MSKHFFVIFRPMNAISCDKNNDSIVVLLEEVEIEVYNYCND